MEKKARLSLWKTPNSKAIKDLAKLVRSSNGAMSPELLAKAVHPYRALSGFATLGAVPIHRYHKRKILADLLRKELSNKSSVELGADALKQLRNMGKEHLNIKAMAEGLNPSTVGGTAGYGVGNMVQYLKQRGIRNELGALLGS